MGFKAMDLCGHPLSGKSGKRAADMTAMVALFEASDHKDVERGARYNAERAHGRYGTGELPV